MEIIMTKSRPIIFTGDSVRAILSGQKTQTRRVIKPQPISGPNSEMVDLGNGALGLLDGVLSGEWKCPYGQPGDLLWVRETFAWWPTDKTDSNPDDGWLYRADDDGEEWDCRMFNWSPSIFMPRRASRLTLKILDVHVEQLQHIGVDDIRDEGVRLPSWNPDTGAGEIDPWELFASLWDSINAKRGFGWDANPWVWAVSFEIQELKK